MPDLIPAVSRSVLYRRCAVEKCMRKVEEGLAFCSIHASQKPELKNGPDRDLAEMWSKEDLITHLHGCAHCKKVRPLKVVWSWSDHRFSVFQKKACPEGARLAAKWIEFDDELRKPTPQE